MQKLKKYNKTRQTGKNTQTQKKQLVNSNCFFLFIMIINSFFQKNLWNKIRYKELFIRTTRPCTSRRDKNTSSSMVNGKRSRNLRYTLFVLIFA